MFKKIIWNQKNMEDKMNKFLEIMPDISMCPGETKSPGNVKICPSRQECYRYKAVASSWQTFSDFNADREGAKCAHFMVIRKRRET